MKKPVFRQTQLIATAVILLLVGLSAGALVYRHIGARDAMTALVSIDGSDLLAIDLSETRGPYEIPLEELAGVRMTLEVRDHSVRVLHSDCPDQICVRAGALSNDMDIAICMPNRVSVVVSHAAEAGTLRMGG